LLVAQRFSHFALGVRFSTNRVFRKQEGGQTVRALRTEQYFKILRAQKKRNGTMVHQHHRHPSHRRQSVSLKIILFNIVRTTLVVASSPTTSLTYLLTVNHNVVQNRKNISTASQPPNEIVPGTFPTTTATT
jgi:hypothetical protein